MLVKMLVKNQLNFSNPIIKGDTDEVRVQSEEPDLRSLLLKQAFCFLRYLTEKRPSLI